MDFRQQRTYKECLIYAAMNYLKQISEFNSRLEIVNLSARSQALWYCLMWHYNKAFWRAPLVISESTLRGELSLTHKQFLAARKELIDGGFIIHYPKQGKKPTSYDIVDLSTERAAVV